MKKILIISFLLLNYFTYSQTEISSEKYNCDLDNGIGQEIYVKELTGEKLQQGDYKLKMMEGSHELFFWFTLLDSGEIDGDLRVTVGNTDSLLVKSQVKKGVVKKIKKFDYKKKYLTMEAFFKGDTIVKKRYNKNKLLYYVHKELDKKEIYEYSCYDYDEIDKCTKIDYLKGLEEKILNGEVISRIKTKNLPANIKKMIENFNNEEKEKKIIIYTNGVKKTRFKNGDYSIEEPTEGGYRFKEYNNKGILIDSGDVYYASDGNLD